MTVPGRTSSTWTTVQSLHLTRCLPCPRSQVNHWGFSGMPKKFRGCNGGARLEAGRPGKENTGRVQGRAMEWRRECECEVHLGVRLNVGRREENPIMG